MGTRPDDVRHRRDYEIIRAGVLTLSVGGEVLTCSPHLAGLLRASPDRVLGQPFRQFVSPASHGLLDRLLDPAAGDGAAGELDLVAADGGAVPVSLSAAALPGGPAAPRRICAMVTDLTDRKRAEAQLRLETAGQLAGGVAHDFNNLLTGIMGSLELLETRVAQGRTETLGRYTGAARALATRAAVVTQRLLAFSRRQPLMPRPVDVNALAAGMEASLRCALGERIALRFVAQPDVWLTLCDAAQLESALLHLAVNAREAMPAGGHLEVAARNVDAGQFVQLRVTDDGAGMPPEVAARAFDPFFTTKPAGQGTGLGLPMIYGFAKQSGGYAQIRSEEGTGTEVSLFLPRWRGQAERPAPAPDQPQVPARLEGRVVLVVEDEPWIRAFVVEALQDMGLRAVVAADGLAGLSALQSEPQLDLMVTDIRLPGLDGRQLAERARALRPALKVLLMTGYAETPDFGSQLLDSGMQMIVKPFAIDRLAGRIREMIGR